MEACHRASEHGRFNTAARVTAGLALVFQCTVWADSPVAREKDPETFDLRARFSLESAYVEQLPEDLDFGGFEQSLQKSAFGTFVFYDKLTEPNKQKVYDGYRQDRNISAIGVTTLELLRSQ